MKRRAAALAIAFVLVPSAAYAAGYRLPVDGTVTDAYRPPTTKYGAGNEGWELSTTAGSPVTAAKAGVVTFAGQVGGTLNVVVTHDDGIRTTYAKLASITVQAGELVTQGQPVGTALADTYFGARRGDAYVDPSSLFDQQVYLVPSTE